MLVSTQQTCAEVNLEGVIESNLNICEVNSNSPADRLKRGLKQGNNKIPSCYEDDFSPRQLTKSEKRHIFETTLKLGNMLVFDETKEDIDPDFIHSYSLRRIVVSSQITDKSRVINLFSKTSGSLASAMILN